MCRIAVDDLADFTMSISASRARCVAHPALLTYGCPRRGERVSAPPHLCTKVHLSTGVQVYLDSLCQEHQALCQEHQVLKGGNRAHIMSASSRYFYCTLYRCVYYFVSAKRTWKVPRALAAALLLAHDQDHQGWPRPSGVTKALGTKGCP